MLKFISGLMGKTPSFLRLETIALGAISTIGMATPSLALSIFAPTANFDNLRPEAFQTSFTNGGITFSDLIIGRTIEPPSFIVKKSKGLFNPVFSSPNFLTFGLPGTFSDFGILGSVKIAPEGNFISEAVSLDVITPNPLFGLKSSDLSFPPIINQAVVLQGFLEGKSVDLISVPLSEFSQLDPAGRFLFSKISLSNQGFDEVQLFASNFAADGVIPLGIDNVRFLSQISFDPVPFPLPQPIPTPLSLSDAIITSESIPESQPITLFGLVGFALAGYLSKKKA